MRDNVYKHYFRFFWAYRLRFLAAVGLITLYAVAKSIQPYFYKLFLEALPSEKWEPVIFVLLLYASIRFAEVILDVVSAYVLDGPILNGARDARVSVFRKIQDLDFAFHLSRSTGSLISIFKRGDLAFFNLIINLQSIYLAMIQLIVTLVVFGQIDPLIMGVMGLTVFISLILSYLVIKYNIGHRTVFNKWEDKVSAVIVDNLINYETVKYFGKEQKEESRLRHVFESWLYYIWKYANSFRIIDIVIGGTSNIGFMVILLMAVLQYMSGNLVLGEVIVVIGFITAFYSRFFEMVYKFREIAKTHVDLRDYFKILDEEEQVIDPEKPKMLAKVVGKIEFEKVKFSYKDGKQNALTNFSLGIKAGESVAFVGESGVGKTTIVKLLLRFFDVNSGAIKIDDIDIRQFKKSTLRSYMGVVPQEPVLFNNTLAFNIAYGREDITHEEIEQAAKMANLHEFIETLPKGYETEVGERGVRLSGGQKQRLAIARMIISNPDIIIFDEATSQLDSVSEKLIQDAFWKASKDKTTLIIAHRLSTVVHADRIVVMDDSGIAEVGTHKELLAIEGGIYKRYWDLQIEEI